MLQGSPGTPSDYLFRASIEKADSFVADLIRWEQERQARKLILIPSESYAPEAVREALGSVFQNIYAEGYPPLRMARETEAGLRDVAWQLAYYRRYADRRFYKGVDYANLIECLAQRRCAALFARDDLRPEHIFVNVQALSGAAANLAVYWALMEPGDCLMALDLYQGGHLTHGSEFNISGRRYHVASYRVDPQTERLNYDVIRDMARRHQPRVIVAGYTSYPWAPSWEKFRAIADDVGAYLVADIAHTAGMAAAGVYPSPIGIADVTTFTTHKTLCGPRGACIVTTNEELSQAIDRAVFPGEQGGPHVNKFAAMAVAFELARTERFIDLQERIVGNAAALADALQSRGLHLAYGGTDTHLLLVDLKSIPSGDGCPIWGEPAVRILDLAGIVANKNTIPGDTETALATGVRLGTPWVTQRGLVEKDMDTLAAALQRLLTGIRPFAYDGMIGTLPRGKVELSLLTDIRNTVADLAAKAGIDFEYKPSGYPHYADSPGERPGRPGSLMVTGWRARQFVQQVATANVADLAVGASAAAFILDRDGTLLAPATISRDPQDGRGRDRFDISVPAETAGSVAVWLRALADGYVIFDDDDLLRKVEGPVTVEESDVNADTEASASVGIPDGADTTELYRAYPERFDLSKPYFVGQAGLAGLAARADKAAWHWETQARPTKHTPLAQVHRSLGARMMPFAGWDMPLWYTSVGEEHSAVRKAAGLFDVGHMGVFEIEGAHATSFLDAVCSNYVAWLEDGQSCYGYLLDPGGEVIDDVMVYRRGASRYLMVVNAANEAKDWNWLNGVNEQRVIIDQDRPWIQTEARAALHDLKEPAAGRRQLRDLALQGPASLNALQSLSPDARFREALGRLRRTNLIEGDLAGVPVVIARTGYTGEDLGYELLVHPDDVVQVWHAILDVGAPSGIVPAGLGARDSTRTEAGLPLYGHELAGPFAISPVEAGFAGYVKYHKPFFVGRDALLAREAARSREVLRFQVSDRNVRRPGLGDPVVNKKGQQIGSVTSCSIDSDGCLLGMAVADRRYNSAGASISVFPLGGQDLADGLLRGARVSMPIAAVVLPRFPERKSSRNTAGE